MELRKPESTAGPDLLPLKDIHTVHPANDHLENPTSCSHPGTPETTSRAVPEAETPEPSREQGIMGRADMDIVCVQPKKWNSEQDVMKQRLMENMDGAGIKYSRSCEHLSYISSEQRIMGSVLKTDQAIDKQPQGCNSKKERTSLLEPKEVSGKHLWPCDRCGRCRCKECTSAEPRPLPSCWLCGRRCACSVEDVLDGVTCVCCLKAVLYHCTSDDEDTSTDAPFSCSKHRRCKRWSTAAALTLVLPCMLCYPPVRGCLALCQLCYQCTDRTRCRCKPAKM